MVLEPATSNVCIFVPESITLLVSPSNSGKSFFIQRVLENKHLFFLENQVNRICYINANSRLLAEVPSIDDLILLTIEDLSNDDIFLEGDLIIIDDLLTATPELINFLKYTVHHKHLTCFVIIQSLIGDKLFCLLYLVHNLVLFLSTSSASRTIQELLSRFFISVAVKNIIKSVVTDANASKSIVSLKLNGVASHRGPSSDILLWSKLEKLFSENYCLAFAEPSVMEQFESISFDASQMNPNQLVLAPARFLKSINKTDLEVNPACSKEQNWNEMILNLNEDIESNFEYKKWSKVKSLSREILKNEQLCVTADGRLILIKEKPKYQFPFLDFLMISTRKHGPGENEEKYYIYAPLMRILLNNHLPHSLIANKNLLNSVNIKSQKFYKQSTSKKITSKRKHGRKQPYTIYSF